ncbi:MAG: hypothetical protein KIT84_27010 [Labilithrix sp.]|nr:hypothetical protein [Labilithrix sp.]MCW5814706.1 hypothetical protein [Labilithrix sp.]
MRRLLLFLLLLVAPPLTDSARADAERGEEAGRAEPAPADAFKDAEQGEAVLAYAHALARYEEAIRAAPASNVAARAEARVAYLRARSEGDFVPLATLEDARRQASPDLHALLVEAESFPEGLVRVEAWVFVADAHARSGRVEDAIPLWRRAARDPHADAPLARRALRSAVDAHLTRGEVEQAEVDLTWYFDPDIAKDVRRLARRRTMHNASIFLVAAALAGTAVAVARSRRRALVLARVRGAARLVVAYAVYVAAGGALLAAGYADGTAGPFLWLGAVLVPLLFAARAWSAAGGAPRPLRAAACAASVLGAAFLVLEHTGHLDGLGL